jgi:hypothetical protein
MYALLFQVILGGVASGASLRIGEGGKGIICGAGIAAPSDKNRASGDPRDQDCPCPGLCASLGNAVEGASSLAIAPWPEKQEPVPIIESIGDLRARHARGASLARAPPHLSSDFA